MFHGEATGVLAGAVLLGLVHGAEPGHGWPIAAAYAMDRSNRWTAGLLASTVIGVGHLISSVAVVAVFFLAKSAVGLGPVEDPVVVGGVAVGSPVGIVAGVVLVALGVREYRHGQAHGHDRGDGHDHSHGGTPGHGDANAHGDSHGHDDANAHDHGDLSADDGLRGLASAAFLLGFAHEEEFEIIALCAGSTYCLELMLVYALAVVLALVALTLLLVAGFTHYEERAERYADYLPTVSAVVLVAMGLGFVLGVF